jgi:hypothetical protein
VKWHTFAPSAASKDSKIELEVMNARLSFRSEAEAYDISYKSRGRDREAPIAKNCSNVAFLFYMLFFSMPE